MPGGGTSEGGAFRFPTQFDDISQEIREKLDKIGAGQDWGRLLDDFTSLYMDRDRALEDYTTAAAGGSIAFVTVDASGDGDYLTIKEALEAVPASTTSTEDGPAVIYVKPSQTPYDETAAGTITIAEHTNILLVAGLANMGLHSNGYTRQHWYSGSVIHTGQQSCLTIKGFHWQTSAPTTPYWHSSSTIGGILTFDDCNIVNPLYSTTAATSYDTINIFNSSGTLHGGIANGTGFPNRFYVRNSQLGLGSFSGGSFGCSAMSFGRVIDFDTCHLNMGFGGATFTGSFSDANGFGAIFSRVRVNSCVWALTQSVGTFACTTVQAVFTNNTVDNGSNNGNNAGTFTFTNCGFGTTSDYGGVEYGNSTITNNNMEQCTLTVTATDNGPAAAYEQGGHPMQITGTWSRVTLGMNHCLAILFMAGKDSDVVLTVTGSNNIIIATFYQYWAGGRPAVTPILMSGNNNYSIVKTGNYSGSYIDSGSGNIWNGAVDAMTMQIADAKGDLLAGWGNDDIRRLAAGSDEQILESYASASTGLGLRWIEPFKRRWNTKGDLLIAAGNDDPQALPVGNEARVPRATSAAYLGVSWEYQRTLNNKLTQNQASLETDTAGWAAEAGCTIARSTAESSHGTASLEITKS